jgi:hypothetical protein
VVDSCVEGNEAMDTINVSTSGSEGLCSIKELLFV